VEFKEPPKESAAEASNAMGQLIQLMRDSTEPGSVSLLLGVNGLGSAVGSRPAARPAEAMTPIRDVVETLEDQVYKPFLYKTMCSRGQCLDRDLVLQIASTEGAPMAERKITVQDIVAISSSPGRVPLGHEQSACARTRMITISAWSLAFHPSSSRRRAFVFASGTS